MSTDHVTPAPSEHPVANMTAGPRIDDASILPAGMRAMVGLQRAVDGVALEPLLLELVTVRASQIDGRGYCLDMRSEDARALGESERCLHLLAARRRSSCDDARERTALARCEDLTLISKQGAPGAVYEKVQQTFLTGGDRRVRDRGHQRLKPAGAIRSGAGGLIRVATPPRIEPFRSQLAAGLPDRTPNRDVNHADSTT